MIANKSSTLFRSSEELHTILSLVAVVLAEVRVSPSQLASPKAPSSYLAAVVPSSVRGELAADSSLVSPSSGVT